MNLIGNSTCGLMLRSYTKSSGYQGPFAFDASGGSGYSFEWLYQMFNLMAIDPSVYVPEIIGLGVLVCFTAWLIKERKVGAFIRNGIAYPTR